MAETLLDQQESGLDLDRDTRQRKSHVKRIVGIFLSFVMFVLAGYVFHLQNQNTAILSQSTQLTLTAGTHAARNYWTYVGRYKKTRIELEETTRKLEEVNRQLDQVTVQLTSTKVMLSQTQVLLFQAQAENGQLKQELQKLDDLRVNENVQTIGQLEDKISVLKDKNIQMGVQLSNLKNQLGASESDFLSLKQGHALIAFFQKKIRSVKERIRYLNQQAFWTRIAAQKEKDRLAVLNGNSGFVLRDGQIQKPNSTHKSFAIDVKVVS